MKFKVLILFLITSLVSVYSQVKPKDDQILATVGNHVITMDDFKVRYEDYLIYSGVQDDIPLRYSILNNMINEVLLHNFDDNSKIYNDSQYQKEIQWAKNEVILAYLKDREIYAKISVSDSELHEAFRRSNIKLEVRHLYAPTEQAADHLYELLQIGVDFKTLAQQVFTDSLLRKSGGYLGYISWGTTDPNFEDAAYSLKVGEISKPVKTAQGYSIIKLENKIANPVMTEYEFNNMKPKLERAVKISKKTPYENAYLEKIFGSNTIKFNDKSIEDIFNDLEKSGYSVIELNNNSTSTLYFCVNYGGKKYGKYEIENLLYETPKYNLEKLQNVKSVETAILALLMQEKLLSIAKEKGYDKNINVTTKFNQLANNIFLNYKRNEILNTIYVPDSVLYSYYDKNIAFFRNENEMNVEEIILQDSSSVKLIHDKLSTGENFGKLAEQYSKRKWSAKNKGEMGLSPVSKFGELKDTLWNSPLGKVIGPLKFGKYTGFFRVIKKVEGQPIEFELLRSKILNAVRNEEGFPYMKKHLDELSKKTDINVNDKLLANFNFNLAG